MNWSLKSQITLPLIGLVLATLTAVTWLNVRQAERQARASVQTRLDRVVATLESANFPLTEQVLRQMTGLSGARFVLVDEFNVMVASSLDEPEFALEGLTQERADSLFQQSVEFGQDLYFWRSSRLQRSNDTLFVLYPGTLYRDSRRQAIMPPLIIGLVGSLLAGVMGILLASHVARPVSRLQRQVERVADGDFQLNLSPTGSRELTALSESVQSMAEKLSHHENSVRRNERLRTLGQLGGGIAHQIRNSITGSLLALNLHQRNCHLPEDESLRVATRQLKLMEEYIQRFLKLGTNSASEVTRIDLAELIRSTLPLLEVSAQHAHVDLEWSPMDQTVYIEGDAVALQQLLINLVINSIEAVSSDSSSKDDPQVRIVVERSSDVVQVYVQDNGPGPSSDIKSALFEPLVSNKPDGAGLGLAVAAEVAKQHAGTLEWKREADWTTFVFSIPIASVDPK
ncbi:MAG: HAMP domain-containing sensor histidine kinase [Planctomycetota bacterium]